METTEEKEKMKKMDVESEPKPEEKEKWMADEKMVAREAEVNEEEGTSSPSPSKSLKRKKRDVIEENGKRIARDEMEMGRGGSLLIPLPPGFCKFDRMQVGSSSIHRPLSRKVIGEHAPLMIYEEQEISKLEERASFSVSLLSESKGLEPENRRLTSLDAAFCETKAEMTEPGPRRWRPPEYGWLKMNVEGLASEHKMAMGVVVRGNDGGFLAAVSKTYDSKTYINAKLIALRNALIWAEGGDGLRHEKVVVELNSEQLVQHLEDFENICWTLPSDLRDILDDCLVLETHFRQLRFANTNAEANQVAHCLASRALHQECEGEWDVLDAPDWLQQAIMEELP